MPIRPNFQPGFGDRAPSRRAATASVLAALVALCGLLGLGVLEASTRNAMQHSMRHAVRVAELRGTIAYLDEYLTMSARVAALSGDERWIRRYDEAEPRLDAAIDEAVALATPEVAIALARTTDDANRRLVALERASFAQIRRGHRAAGWALLDGEEYARLKGIYAEGIATFGRDLTALAAAQTASLRRRSWLEACGLVLGAAILLVATVLSFRSRQRLRQMLAFTEMIARHDPLTGLPNRLRFREHMEQVLEGLRSDGVRCGAALLYLDLDGFKGVNDTYGHAAGDDLLCAVSERILSQLGGNELVVRLGGDEFAIIQADVADHQATTALCERLLIAMREPVEVRGNLISITTSIGVATADAALPSIDELLREADIALYQAKAGGRSTWRMFVPEMDERIRARRSLEDDLRRALAEQQFELHYQPLVDARTLHVNAFEALLRWRHPRHGMISPSAFIPVAEEIGLIVTIGRWVLQQACSDAATWPDHVGVAVNLSPLEFEKGEPVLEVEQALASSGLHPGRLQIEITESVLLKDNEKTLSDLHHLRRIGVRISMNDFGTGYSSLGYLRRFPFDKVKIDQSFISDPKTERDGIQIVRAVVQLGRALGIQVLVEGIESDRRLKLLAQECCDEYQGYILGKPMPLRDASTLIASWTRPIKDREPAVPA